MTTLFTTTARKISLALAFDRLVLRRFIHRELRLQLGSAAAVHRRRVPPLQLGNPEYSADHRLHDQAPHRSERWLPRCHGSRTRLAEVRQARRAITTRFLQSLTAQKKRLRRCDAGVFPFLQRSQGRRAVAVPPATSSPGTCSAGRRYRTPLITVPGYEGIADEQSSFRHFPGAGGIQRVRAAAGGTGRLLAGRFAILPGADAGWRPGHSGLPEAEPREDQQGLPADAGQPRAVEAAVPAQPAPVPLARSDCQKS